MVLFCSNHLSRLLQLPAICAHLVLKTCLQYFSLNLEEWHNDKVLTFLAASIRSRCCSRSCFFFLSMANAGPSSHSSCNPANAMNALRSYQRGVARSERNGKLAKASIVIYLDDSQCLSLLQRDSIPYSLRFIWTASYPCACSDLYTCLFRHELWNSG